MGAPQATVHQLAHNLNDCTRTRSKDVALSENITFDHFLLTPETAIGLKSCGFNMPSPVQLEAIPLARCGFDLVVQSKAGTGKTCVFAIVALESLKFNRNKSTQTIVIAPTREVAIQIHEVISLLGSAYLEFDCALCIGGVDVKQDRAKLANKCQIVVGTPGRIKQLIELGIVNTQQIELFVLDEADKLMDEQFKIQIDDIYKRLPIDKQMIVTSATYPDELSLVLQGYMRSPKSIRIAKELCLEAVSELYVKSKAGHSTKSNLDNKMEVLKAILQREEYSKCFIFTNYQARAPLICDNLNSNEEFQQTYGKINYICAELSQVDRNLIFTNFKNSNQQKLLISTDVSARGIDIKDIELVINFDIPNDNATYYHRIGRAGRFGQPGRAITIVSNNAIDKSLFANSVKSDKLKELIL